MKVLISYVFCTKGGVETAIYNRLKNIDRTKLQVDLLFFDDYGGLSLFGDFQGKVWVEREKKEIQGIIEDEDYNIVLAIDTPKMLNILSDMKYDGKIGMEVHTTYEVGLKYLKRREIDKVDFFIVPSEYQKKLVESYGIKKEIYVLGNAISDKIIFNANIKKDYEKRIILWVGRLDAHKNWRLFLKIAKELKEKSDDFIFYLVGGLRSEISEINAFENEIYNLGLACDVRWIPQVEYDKMGDWYSSAANSGGCYISTSSNESFGMTVIEAMACNCPVVVNNVGALPELVDDNRGLCLDIANDTIVSERIINYIKNIYRDKENMDYISERYSSQNIFDTFYGIISKVYKDTF